MFLTGWACQEKEPPVQPDDPPTLYRAWVGFTDKGDPSERRIKRIYRKLEKSFPERTLERRKKRRTAPGLFDEYDIPIPQKYLHALEDAGAEIRIRSHWLNGTTVVASEYQLRQIAGFSFVKEVTDRYEYIKDRSGLIDDAAPVTRELQGQPAEFFPGYQQQFYGLSREQVEQINLHHLHRQDLSGKGIRIGVLDTGFFLKHKAFNHPDHPIHIISQWDLVNNDSITDVEPVDAIGQHIHGTFILGTLASHAPFELVGNAWEAEYILCKAEDALEEYPLEEKWFVAALEYAERMGADIITSSLVLYHHYASEDMDGQTSVMTLGWNIATRNGVIGFEGSGNYGHDEDPALPHLEVPADAMEVITVGAVRSDGTMARFSSDGPTADGRIKPEVVCRGEQVYTISPIDPELFTTASGTSLATPQMAGAVACLLQAIPDLNVEGIRTLLFDSGDYYREHGQPDSLFVRGYGIPDFQFILDEWNNEGGMME
jgi:subtilisin family serine protease